VIRQAQPTTILGAILLGAVALRLAYVIVFGGTLSLQLSGYDDYARHLMAGQGYTRFADLHADSDLPPLYPFFLVGVYSVLGRSTVAVALVQIVFDVVSILAIYAIAARLGGPPVGLLAAAFLAFYPYLLFQDLSTNDTAIFIMLLTLAIWAVYRTCDSPRAWRWALAAGLLFGLAALTKTLVVLILPLIALWWWRNKGLRAAAWLSIVLAVGFAIFPLPWIVRNTRLHGAFTLISTNDGSNLYQGNNPCAADYLLRGWDVQWSVGSTGCVPAQPQGLPELEEAAWFRDQALTYLRSHVSDWPRLFGSKLLNLWSVEIMPRGVPPTASMQDQLVLQYEQPAFQVARVVHLVYFTPLLILAFIGLWRTLRDGRSIGPLLSVPIAITIAYVIYHPSTRYRSPADPFVFVFAAYAVAWLWQVFRLRRAAITGPR
jgi:4-amino-4-deoxy-L-arabinose transferase-like glycosyltransferase